MTTRRTTLGIGRTTRRASAAARSREGEGVTRARRARAHEQRWVDRIGVQPRPRGVESGCCACSCARSVSWREVGEVNRSAKEER